MWSWTETPIRRVAIAAAALLVLAALGAPPLRAAPERLTIPLSNTGQPAVLDAALITGSIRVVAGFAGQVVVDVAEEAASDQDDDADPNPDPDDDRARVAGKAKDKEAKDDKNRYAGMRRIPNPAVDLVAEEEGNRVTVRSGARSRPVELRIAVPAGSSLRLSTVNGGGIEVDGVTGELELHNTNGPIRVRGARGPVTANTVNGDVEVVFGAGAVAGAMAFSTLNGDVDLTLPAGVEANLRLHTDHGEIYSDFDVALEPDAPRVEQDRSRGKYRVSLAKELRGKIGGGGAELFLKTFNGDIVLRRGGRAE